MRQPAQLTARQRERRLEDEQFGRRATAAPVPGLYAWRFKKDAVEVAAEIRHEPTADPDFPDNAMDRTALWSARISGQDDANASPEPSDTVWSVYEHGRRIERAEFDWLVADRRWAAAHAPALPEANPKRPVDLRTLDPRVLL